jgi:hypothetical protein
MNEITMLTITQWIERGLTDLTAREMQKKVKKGDFEGVEVVGKTLRFPDTEANKKAAKRQRDTSHKRNKSVKTP